MIIKRLVVLICLFFAISLVFGVLAQAASAWDGNSAGEVQWAEAQVGNYGWTTPNGTWQESIDQYGWCAKFVANVFGAQSTGIGDAVDLKNSMVNAGLLNTSAPTNAPVGSLVFFNLTQWGHVGVHVGGGYVVHAGYSEKVRKDYYTAIGNYAGWAYPPFSHWPGRSDPSNDSPTGSLDIATSSEPGTVRVAGWAFDPNVPTQPIDIHVYIGASAGVAGAEPHNAGAASGSRPDVGSVYPSAGNNHGYDQTITTAKRGTQNVYVYAINAAGTSGDNILIGSGTVNIADPPSSGDSPTGSLDLVASSEPGTVRVAGWVFDPNVPTQVTDIHVYIGASAGEAGAEPHNAGAASGSRPDVGSAYPSAGSSHGYDVTLTTSKRGTQNVYVYGINVAGTAGDNVLIGSGTVNIADPPSSGDSANESSDGLSNINSGETSEDTNGGNNSGNDSSQLLGDKTAFAGEVAFPDIPIGAWYQTYVTKLSSTNVIGGYSDGKFRPDNNVTRAEFAKMICVAKGWTLENPSSPSFNDVSQGDWFYKYVETAKAHKAIEGYQDGTFRPNNYITRAEIATVLANIQSLSPYTCDLKDIDSSWAKDNISACVKAGIVGGYKDNTFRPNNTATRAETAKMIYGVI